MGVSLRTDAGIREELHVKPLLHWGLTCRKHSGEHESGAAQRGSHWPPVAPEPLTRGRSERRRAARVRHSPGSQGLA